MDSVRARTNDRAPRLYKPFWELLGWLCVLALIEPLLVHGLADAYHTDRMIWAGIFAALIGGLLAAYAACAVWLLREMTDRH